MKELKEEFPLLNNYTYLNTAASGLLPKCVQNWRQKHDQDFFEGASIFRESHKTHIENIKKTVANFVGCTNSEVALIPNFSFGMNTILEGLPKKSKILLLENDYPSINWPVENRGFEVVFAKIDQNLESHIQEAVKKHKPDVFAFSIVQYLSGILIDFDFLKRLKNENPNLILIADGTQFIGTRKFNFEKSGIDILGASCYKWLLAGYGNGFLIVRDEIQQKLHPESIGFNSAEAMNSKRDDVKFMKRFEPGHHDTLNFGSLKKAIELLNDLGMTVIDEKIRSLSETAKNKFAERGLIDASVMNRNDHSSIFNITGNDALFQKLNKHNIITSPRGNGIRVSFHFYNTEADLNRLLDVIDK